MSGPPRRVLAGKHGFECGFVCGQTPDIERDELLARFRGASKSLIAPRSERRRGEESVHCQRSDRGAISDFQGRVAQTLKAASGPPRLMRRHRGHPAMAVILVQHYFSFFA